MSVQLKNSANNAIYPKTEDKDVYVGVILDAGADANRFPAMKELFDIASGKSPTTAFTHATKGIVCRLPKHNTAMYEKYDFDAIFAKDANVLTSPASTTKVVSLVTGMDYIASIKDKVTITADDIEAGSGDTFYAGDILTIEDIMKEMLLPSSNTCAKTFAHYVGKKILNDESATAAQCVSAFITAMNEKAVEIGCANHLFDSPSGLSDTNKTTASDLLRFVIAACSYSEILRIWNKKTEKIKVGGSNARTITTNTTVTNAALEADYYIFGGKTGSLGGGVQAAALVMVAEPK